MSWGRRRETSVYTLALFTDRNQTLPPLTIGHFGQQTVELCSLTKPTKLEPVRAAAASDPPQCLHALLRGATEGFTRASEAAERTFLHNALFLTENFVIER